MDTIRRMFETNGNEQSLKKYEVSSAVSNAKAAAEKAEDLVQRMAEATAWMNDPTILPASEEETTDHDDADNEEAVEEEWYYYWSEAHNREYYHNRVTNECSWSIPHRVEIDCTEVEEMNSDEDVSCTLNKSTSTESTATSVTTCEWNSFDDDEDEEILEEEQHEQYEQHEQHEQHEQPKEDEELNAEWCAYSDWRAYSSETYNREYDTNSVTDVSCLSKQNEIEIDPTGIKEGAIWFSNLLIWGLVLRMNLR